MTTRRVRRFRIIESILSRSSLLQGRPRSIDRYIDYFGEGQPPILSGARAT